jgi:oxygen-independent coproporphyrinogen-3 oxidase
MSVDMASVPYVPPAAATADSVRRLLKKRLGGDPGTLNFCYPYARFMNTGGAEQVAASWSSMAVSNDAVDVTMYVHIPFCPGHCMFCGFATTYGLGDDRVDHYLSAVEREVASFRHQIPNAPFRVRALFIGGGTPNYLKPTQFDRLMRCLRTSFTFAPDCECTVELYPSVDMILPLIEPMRQAGINRVSVCAQDFNDDVLGTAKRFYRGADALHCARALRDGGMDAMNVDLMIGIPLQTMSNAAANLDALGDLHPSHVTLNPFSRRSPTIPWGRKSFDRVMAGADEIRSLYDFYRGWLFTNGYRQVTKTNFERRNSVGFHYEALVRASRPRIGFGVNALSFTGAVTYRNVQTLEGYARAAMSDILPVEATYILESDNARLCRSFFAVLSNDIAFDDDALHDDPGGAVASVLEVLTEFGLMQNQGGVFTLTDHGVWNIGIVQRCFLPREILNAVVGREVPVCN